MASKWENNYEKNHKALLITYEDLQIINQFTIDLKMNNQKYF